MFNLILHLTTKKIKKPMASIKPQFMHRVWHDFESFCLNTLLVQPSALY